MSTSASIASASLENCRNIFDLGRVSETEVSFGAPDFMSLMTSCEGCSFLINLSPTRCLPTLVTELELMLVGEWRIVLSVMEFS